MQYQQFFPPESLTAYIRYFWVVEQDNPLASPKTFGPVADGCPGMLLQLSESGTFYDAYHQPFPRFFMYGQTISPIKIRTSGSFRTIGVYFYPNTLKALLGWDAEELTNGCLDLNILPETRTFQLSDQLLSASSTESQITIISTYLRYLISRNRLCPDETTLYALSRLQQSKGALSLKALQEDIRLSERGLERKFKQWVGISPKVFSRVCRFQAALHQLRTGNYHKLSDIAFDHAYADQSHFIRSFREFTGFSPYQYQQQSREVIKGFPELM